MSNLNEVTRPVTTTAPAASFRNVAVDFPAPGGGTTRVLHDVSFDLHQGEMLVLVGRSGCGKTTALNVLAGLIEPAGGSVFVGDVPAESARKKLGYMFARDALLPWRTALRNVEFGLELRGVPKRDREKIALEYLKLVHLDGKEQLYPSQLSQGMRQRAALARTWAISPEVMLMDEPFAALDAQTRESVQRQFVRLWEQDRRSVIFVTHDLNEAIMMADRIVVFANGTIADEYVIPFKRPRDIIELSAEPEFKNIYREIRELLAEETS